MPVVIISGIAIVVCGVVLYIIISSRNAEMQKYYDAAYKIIKENCLNQAIRNIPERVKERQRIMVYLKWKDQDSGGYVFDPLLGIRIGRDPEKNEICIRESTVSSSHCQLYLADRNLAIQDFQSMNGTFVKRNFWKHRVQGSEYLYSGDQIIVGSMKIKVTIFTFDMTNI